MQSKTDGQGTKGRAVAKYIDFDAIKAQVSFQDIFAHYGIEVKRQKGSELSVLCPFHNDSKPSLKANVERGVFNCFGGCGAKGDVIAFVQRKEGIVSGDRNQDRVLAARRIVSWFGLSGEEVESPVADDASSIKSKVETDSLGDERADEVADVPEVGGEESAEPNPVLTFRLKVDQGHAYLRERGLSEETVARFGLGYCARGLMKGRVVIPIENDAGLVGYAGRWPGESGWPEGEEKYSLPPNFKKSQELYNLVRVPQEARYVVLVEGYWSVCWLWQELGMENVVAAMGSSLGEHQQALLWQRFRGVQIFFDGDAAGKRAGIEVASALVRRMWVRVIDCPEGLQPDKLSVADIKHTLEAQFQR